MRVQVCLAKQVLKHHTEPWSSGVSSMNRANRRMTQDELAVLERHARLAMFHQEIKDVRKQSKSVSEGTAAQ